MVKEIFRVTDGMPEDAEVLDVEYVPGQRLIVLYMEHESFEPVQEATMVPEKIIKWDQYPVGEIHMEREDFPTSKNGVNKDG